MLGLDTHAGSSESLLLVSSSSLPHPLLTSLFSSLLSLPLSPSLPHPPSPSFPYPLLPNFFLSFSRAKLLLKKKRYLESLLDKTDTQLDNLEQMVENIEFTQIEMKVVEGLKQGNECLEQMHKVWSK